MEALFIAVRMAFIYMFWLDNRKYSIHHFWREPPICQSTKCRVILLCVASIRLQSGGLNPHSLPSAHRERSAAVSDKPPYRYVTITI